MSRHRGGRALAGEPDLCSHCQARPWAKPVSLSQGGCRPRCSALSALALAPAELSGHLPGIRFLCAPPPLLRSPTHQHLPQGFCTAALLPRILSPSRLSPWPSLSPPPGSAHFSLQYQPPDTLLLKLTPVWHSPATLRLPPVGFMALFLAKALLPFSRFLKLTYFNCLFSVPHARPGRQADLSLFASLVCLAGPGEGGG